MFKKNPMKLKGKEGKYYFAGQPEKKYYDVCPILNWSALVQETPGAKWQKIWFSEYEGKFKGFSTKGYDFDEVHNFIYDIDMARVKKDGKYYYIDRDINLSLDCYDYAEDYMFVYDEWCSNGIEIYKINHFRAPVKIDGHPYLRDESGNILSYYNNRQTLLPLQSVKDIFKDKCDGRINEDKFKQRLQEIISKTYDNLKAEVGLRNDNRSLETTEGVECLTNFFNDYIQKSFDSLNEAIAQKNAEKEMEEQKKQEKLIANKDKLEMLDKGFDEIYKTIGVVESDETVAFDEADEETDEAVESDGDKMSK